MRLPRQRGRRQAGKGLPGELLVDHPPEPGEEPPHPLDAGVLPLLVLVGGAHEEDVEAERIGAEAIDELVGRDHVALRLRHLGAEAVDHPLVEEPRERLGEPEQPAVGQRLREEARIHQVEDRVLDPADVLVDGEPVVDERAVERCLVVPGIGVAEEVPGRVHERVHRVGLALRRPRPHAGAGNVHPLLGGRQRRAAPRAGSRRSQARSTGSSDSGTGTIPHPVQWMIGIGQPQ